MSWTFAEQVAQSIAWFLGLVELILALYVLLLNPQLFKDARRRAIGEQFTRQITTRIRESLDTDTSLKTSVQELGRVLGAGQVTTEITGPGESNCGSAEQQPVKANNGDTGSALAEE